MSSNLVYHTRPKEKDLSYELKVVFQVLYGCPVNTILTESHIAQLKAMSAVYKSVNKAARAKELQGLIDAIDKYDTVYLKENFG